MQHKPTEENNVDKIRHYTLSLAQASKGNPVICTLTVMLFYIMFNLLEASIERLIFGERFEHWLDPLFQCGFIGYAGYAVYMCAAWQLAQDRGA